MFGWFGNKNKVREAEVVSHVGASRKMAFVALAEKLKEKSNADVFFFFPQTRDEFMEILSQQQLNGNISFQDAGKYRGQILAGNSEFFCLEFPPLYSSFQKLLQQLGAGTSLHVYSGLDEPLFDQFGGERILSLMKTLGMKEDELIEHKMVTQSIERAQKKLEEKMMFSIQASSSKEWFDKFNLQKNNS